MNASEEQQRGTYGTAMIDTSLDVGPRTFATIIRGDQMTPEFPPGAIIVVEPDMPAEAGDYVLVEVVTDEEPIFRLVVQDGPRRFLKAMNAAYPTVELMPAHRVLGVIREQVKRYR